MRICIPTLPSHTYAPTRHPHPAIPPPHPAPPPQGAIHKMLFGRLLLTVPSPYLRRPYLKHAASRKDTYARRLTVLNVMQPFNLSSSWCAVTSTLIHPTTLPPTLLCHPAPQSWSPSFPPPTLAYLKTCGWRHLWSMTMVLTVEQSRL